MRLHARVHRDDARRLPFMSVAAFDTLKLVRRLEASGMPGPQAAGLAEAFAEIMVTELATKSDLRELRAELRAELRVEVGSLRTEMEKLRGELRTEIAASKNETLRWVVPLMLGQMALSLGILLRVSS
jgi:hypothetical protein